MDSNSEIQRYKVYLMLHFCRKFSSSITTQRKEEYFRKKSTARHIIFDGKDLVRERVIIKKGEGHVSLRSLGGISERKS